MSAVALLRTHTATQHEAVDAAFGALRLDQPASYRDFLLAHALALPAAEAVMAVAPDLPAWRPRAPLLARDLADLGAKVPTPLPFAAPNAAFTWGVLYVVEGSRLGGAMLAGQVSAGLPQRYLAATFEQGEWRGLRAAIDAQGTRGGDPWLAQALDGATACFDLYRRAAATLGL